MGKLILVRHGNSMWNKKNIFTGWVDVSLSKQGVKEAFEAGKVLSKLKFDDVYTSALLRAQMTLQLLMLENEDERTLVMSHSGDDRYERGVNNASILKVNISEALNERYYGDLQGKEKEAFKKEVGENLFKTYRRSFDVPPPNGESLEMTINRTLPYFDTEILPKLKDGKTVLIVAHGNSLRGIVKEVMTISDEEIVNYEIATGNPLIFNYENQKFKEVTL